jgi:hypothetical protein
MRDENKGMLKVKDEELASVIKVVKVLRGLQTKP